MRLEFDDGTLLLGDVLDDIPPVEWIDQQVNTVRNPLYRSLLNRAGARGSVGGFITRSRSQHPKSEI
jgi:hypothetical protein